MSGLSLGSGSAGGSSGADGAVEAEVSLVRLLAGLSVVSGASVLKILGYVIILMTEFNVIDSCLGDYMGYIGNLSDLNESIFSSWLNFQLFRIRYDTRYLSGESVVSGSSVNSGRSGGSGVSNSARAARSWNRMRFNRSNKARIIEIG